MPAPTVQIYRFIYEIAATSEDDARERLEELIAQEGFAVDLEGTYPLDDDE
jgi:hypothetical protein